MTVTLTIADTYANAKAATSSADALLGGGLGIDLGTCVTASYAPVTDRVANTGARSLYLAHDGVNEITEVKFYMQNYEVGTGDTYGGARTAAQDLTELINLGSASGSSKNNADGLSGGLWIDMNAQTANGSANFFDQAGFPANVKIFGDNGTDGLSETTAFDLVAAAMIQDAGGTAASAPVLGSIGADGDTVLGDAALIRTRIYLPSAYAEGGYFQAAFIAQYSFTS